MPLEVKLLETALRMALTEPLSVSQQSLANLLGAGEFRNRQVRAA
jgi:hypothetical protein